MLIQRHELLKRIVNIVFDHYWSSRFSSESGRAILLELRPELPNKTRAAQMVKSTNGKTNWTQDRRPVDSPRGCGHHRPFSCLVDAPHVRSLVKRADIARAVFVHRLLWAKFSFLSRLH